MERRRYRTKTHPETNIVPNEHLKRKQALKSISDLERTPEVRIQRMGTTRGSAAVDPPRPKPRAQDHLLLVVKAVVQGTRVPALIDSGASHSFVSDQLVV